MKYKDIYLKSIDYKRVTDVAIDGTHTDLFYDENGIESQGVKDIYNAYDQLPDAKDAVKTRIKQHASGLVNAIYPHIDAETSDVIGFYNYTVDMWGGGALPARLQALKAVRDTAVSKISQVNVMTDWQAIDALDVTVGW